MLATQVYGAMRGVRWSEQFGEGDRRVVIGEGRIGPFRLTDAMAFELGADGRPLGSRCATSPDRRTCALLDDLGLGRRSWAAPRGRPSPARLT